MPEHTNSSYCACWSCTLNEYVREASRDHVAEDYNAGVILHTQEYCRRLGLELPTHVLGYGGKLIPCK